MSSRNPDSDTPASSTDTRSAGVTRWGRIADRLSFGLWRRAAPHVLGDGWPPDLDAREEEADREMTPWIAPAVAAAAFLLVFGGYVAIAGMGRPGAALKRVDALVTSGVVSGMAWFPGDRLQGTSYSQTSRYFGAPPAANTDAGEARKTNLASVTASRSLRQGSGTSRAGSQGHSATLLSERGAALRNVDCQKNTRPGCAPPHTLSASPFGMPHVAQGGRAVNRYAGKLYRPHGRHEAKTSTQMASLPFDHH
ncbi:hypothetical protein [Paraburkholderia phytofirmans]|uniref:hypothetical protein n=1 Tax=Paraburkholderia phytofirmans TaxID=261302 RepID=UPI0011E05FAF|nr:hypothetical protein [Paraburkholderia phytofirmans]